MRVRVFSLRFSVPSPPLQSRDVEGGEEEKLGAEGGGNGS